MNDPSPPQGESLLFHDVIIDDQGTKVRVWTSPGYQGIKFSGKDPEYVRERDPRNIPGQIMEHRPAGLEPCHLHSTLPAEGFIYLAEEYFWRPGESLWYGTMHPTDLEAKTEIWTNIYRELIPFFNDPRTVTWNYKKDRYDNHMPEKWRPIWGRPDMTGPDYPPNMSTEILCKAMWLITEYLDADKKYDNPMCAHYNPKLRDNIIHPGGFRKKLLKMYNDPDDDIKVFYFNTLGFYQQKSMKKLTRYDWRDLKADAFNGNRAHGSLVAEHGTLIPHIYLGSNVIFNRQHDFLDIIQERISRPDFKISFNEPWVYQNYSDDLPFILPETEYGNAYCNVFVSSPNHHPWAKVSQEWYRDMIVMMGVIHALLNRPYQDEKIQIEFSQ